MWKAVAKMTQPWKLKNKMCHGTRTEQLTGCKIYEELFRNIFCCQRSVEESLERLGVDYIDVIQVKQTYQWIFNRQNKNTFLFVKVRRGRHRQGMHISEWVGKRCTMWSSACPWSKWSSSPCPPSPSLKLREKFGEWHQPGSIWHWSMQ